jgi:hypothetical protein
MKPRITYAFRMWAAILPLVAALWSVPVRAQIAYNPPRDVFTRNAATLVSNATGGTDVNCTGTEWRAFRFTMVGTSMGGFSLSIKRDVGTSAGNVRMYLYSDSTGPNADISDTSTGMPTIVYQSGISTSYSTVRFRQQKTGLTNGANYWGAILCTGVTGGNFSFNTRASGTNRYATAADSGGSPGAWTASGSEGVFTVYGNSGNGAYSYSENQYAFDGESVSGFAVRGVSVSGPGAKFDSTYNFGVGGTSTDGVGVRGSSTNNIAVQGVSAGSAGGQFQTTASGSAGVQAVSTTGAAFQSISSDGFLFQGYNLANASNVNIRWISEDITLSTSGGTTDSTADLLPANSIILGIPYRIQTTITVATDMQMGDSTTSQRFLAQHNPSAMTAGTTGNALDHWLGTAARFPGQKAAAKLRITLNGTPNAGVVRVVVYYILLAVPSS